MTSFKAQAPIHHTEATHLETPSRLIRSRTQASIDAKETPIHLHPTATNRSTNPSSVTPWPLLRNNPNRQHLRTEPNQDTQTNTRTKSKSTTDTKHRKDKSKQEDQAAKQGHPTSLISEPLRLAHDHQPKPTRSSPLRTSSKHRRSRIGFTPKLRRDHFSQTRLGYRD
ncbi:hypothetical protein Rs2_50966 [Raphanus sativus]|nr:hypothetical protein Rs2_50966 [Raphanus sativus]